MHRLALVMAVLVLVFSYTLADSNEKRPLDLPAGRFGLGPEDEEDLSESIIFYGHEYEAQAFVWALDRSGSMVSENRIGILKQEVTQAINSLTRRSEIGVVAFASSVINWSSEPKKATPAHKATAIAWVQSLEASGSTCMAAGGVRGVQLCNLSSKRTKAVILASDGMPSCENCETACNAITTANWQRLRVNALFLGSNAEAAGCLQSIANANSGSFRQIQ